MHPLTREQIENTRKGLLADAAWSQSQHEDHWSDERINALCDMALRAIPQEQIDGAGGAGGQSHSPEYLYEVLTHTLIPTDFKKRDALFALIAALERPDSKPAQQNPPVSGESAAAPVSQQGDCTRSHPHENMDKCCELRTEIARLRNKLAQQDKAGIAAVTAAEYTRGREDGYEAGRMFERQADSSQGSSAADTKEG